MKKARQARVGKKIATLRREGIPRARAIATAMNMERRRRLTSAGGYRRVKGGRRRRR